MFKYINLLLLVASFQVSAAPLDCSVLKEPSSDGEYFLDEVRFNPRSGYFSMGFYDQDSEEEIEKIRVLLTEDSSNRTVFSNELGGNNDYQIQVDLFQQIQKDEYYYILNYKAYIDKIAYHPVFGSAHLYCE